MQKLEEIEYDEDQYEDDAYNNEGMEEEDIEDDDQDEEQDQMGVPNNNLNNMNGAGHLLNQYNDSEANYTPGNAAQQYDRVQMNQNFQFPGAATAGGNNRVPQQQYNNNVTQGRLRPQSAKTGDEQLRFQQLNNPQTNSAGVWNGLQMPPDQQYSYNQINTNTSLQNGGNPPALIGGFTAPYAQGGFYQNIGNNGMKKRPTTANRRNNNMVQQIGQAKKSFGSKNPSTLDLEISRMRPRVINQERERLYDDALKNKMTANFLKEENVKLKTKIHIIEGELNKKEKLIDDLLQQQDSYNISNGPMSTGLKQSKQKLESHLCMNLKRKIREMQIIVQQKHDEIESLKKNIKSTKIAEIELEMKMYIDECTRLRHQLEEVIKSKDTFADPEELKIIESKFQQQDMLINQMKNENNELAMAYTKKEEENNQLRALIESMEKKQKKASTISKEANRLKKQLRDKEKDMTKVKLEIQSQKLQNEEYRNKIEELVKKNQNAQYSNKPAWQPPSYQQQNQIQSNNQSYMLDNDSKKLRQELSDKENKIKELNGVVQQLQVKLQDKMTELTKEQAEKTKYKDLYDQSQDKVAQLEIQLEEGGIKPIQTTTKQPQAQKEQPKQSAQQPAQTKQQQIPKVDKKQILDVILELKMKLQLKAFYPNQIKDFFFKPYTADSQVTIKQLQDVFDSNGIKEKQSLFLARYLIEPQTQSQIAYDENASATQKQIVTSLQDLIGHYSVYNDNNLIKKYNEKITKLLGGCKNTLKDTLQLEDYEDEGYVPFGAIKESFETLDIKIDTELLDYIHYVIYSRSESTEKMKYQALLDLIDGKLVQGQLSVGSEKSVGGGRKRPESSSPEKLKARNKDKFNNGQQQEQVKQQQQQKQKAKQAKDDDDDDQYDENYEEEFEKLLDQDDEDADDDQESGTNNQKNLKNQQPMQSNKGGKYNKQPEDSDNYDEDFEKGDTLQKQQQMNDEDEEDDYIDEEEMLDVAERCFVKIAEAIIAKQQTVRQSFKPFIIKEQLEGQVLELLSPIGFLEGIKDLGIIDLEEVEVACLMRVLTKADLENAILLRELIVIMENFGIQDDEGGNDDDDNYEDEDGGAAQGPAGDNNNKDDDDEDYQEQQPQKQPDQAKKKKAKKSAKQMDLAQLDEKSIKILAKLMLALMELNVSLYDFFDGAIYEQLVKTKTKQNMVEIINAKDFFDLLQKQGVRKSNNEHENLKKFLALDANYTSLLMIKKVAKALDEMAKNEELMAGILAAAEGQDEDGNQQYEEDFENTGQQQQPGQKRLITIGEDEEDNKQYDSKSKNIGNNQINNAQQQKQQQQQEAEDDYEYDENEYEEGGDGDDDYEF